MEVEGVAVECFTICKCDTTGNLVFFGGSPTVTSHIRGKRGRRFMEPLGLLCLFLTANLVQHMMFCA